MKTYKYVGPRDLLVLVETMDKGAEISSQEDILKWVKHSEQVSNYDNSVIATYTVNIDKKLFIADRHSEHVLCAGGENVLSAGEITFHVDKDIVEVLEVTNQSTGYCPEPESWPYVKEAIENIGLESPERFSTEFIFRKCNRCKLLNIVKDYYFVCVGCGDNLDNTWNVS